MLDETKMIIGFNIGESKDVHAFRNLNVIAVALMIGRIGHGQVFQSEVGKVNEGGGIKFLQPVLHVVQVVHG